MKKPAINKIYAALTGIFAVSVAYLLEQAVVFFRPDLVYLSSATIEEGLKYLSLIAFKPAMNSYIWTVAAIFTIFELILSYQSIISTGHLWLFGFRLIPHFLFAAAFLFGAKERRFYGFIIAYALHTAWNLAAASLNL